MYKPLLPRIHVPAADSTVPLRIYSVLHLVTDLPAQVTWSCPFCLPWGGYSCCPHRAVAQQPLAVVFIPSKGYRCS